MDFLTKVLGGARKPNKSRSKANAEDELSELFGNIKVSNRSQNLAHKKKKIHELTRISERIKKDSQDLDRDLAELLGKSFKSESGVVFKQRIPTNHPKTLSEFRKQLREKEEKRKALAEKKSKSAAQRKGKRMSDK
jgi:PAB1-binding protein PBP1